MLFGLLPYAVGANLGFRRQVFDAIGGFDGSFETGADEVDFCWRAQYAGFTIGFATSAVVHYRLREQRRALARQSYHYAIGNAHLYAKHQELGRLPKQTRRARWSLLYGQIKRLAHLERLIQREHRWFYMNRAASFAGMLRGLIRYRVVASGDGGQVRSPDASSTQRNAQEAPRQAS